MPNKQYLSGRRKEQKIVKAAKDQGLIALRSAGSKSCVDCVIIDSKSKQIQLIQCKPNSWTSAQQASLEAKYTHLNGIYGVTFKVR